MAETPSSSLSENISYISEHILQSNDDVPDIFSELLELVKYEDGYQEWKEAARWIKFKENVEVEGNRWSKPHVSTPSLQGWLRLRQSLRSGLTLIDLRAHSLREICDIVGEHLESRGDVTRDESIRLQDLWMKKHRHQFEGPRKPDGKLTAVLKELLVQKLENKSSNISGLRVPSRMSSRSGSRRCSISFAEDPEDSYFSKKALTEGKINYSLQKKISSNTEACIMLVGVVSFLKKPVSVFIRLENAVVLGDLPEVDITTRFIYICVGPQQVEKNGMESSAILHDMGVSLATALTDKSFAKQVYKCVTVDDLLGIFDEYTNDLKTLPRDWDSTVRIDPPAKSKTGKELDEMEEIDEDRRMREKSGLVRSGRFFGGLINDIKRKRPFYASDFINGLHPQCISSFMFLYFACLTPIVAFGSLLGQATENRIATIESLMSGLICGILFGLFSGQPLILLGSTGPVYVFEKILYTMCKDQDWDYLSFRLWIGIWVGAILILLVAFDAGAYVCYITRFTEELFATLISFIFIFNAFKNLESIRSIDMEFLPPECACLNSSDTPKSNCTRMDANYTEGCIAMESEVLLMSIFLFSGSFFISFTLKQIKNTGYFPSRVRDFLSDFSVVIAIGLMTAMDSVVGIHTPKLDVPSSFKPTWEGRDWIVTHALIFTEHLLSNPWWVDVFLAPVFAILATILIFMDQQITAVIVNKKENQLMKGGGYHLDMLVLAITIIICSVFGLPWFVAATVLSINHIQSLTKESESSVPGEKPQFLGIREQRVTHVLIAICLGLSTLITPLLALIPMPVLFGIFLYMGVNSLKGLQFFDRLLLLFIPKKYQPDYIYLKYVPLGRVHVFTIVQLSALIGLWIIKNDPSTSISFPIMLVVICGIRKGLECFFTRRELLALDDLLPEGETKRRHGGKESSKLKSPKNPNRRRHSMELQEAISRNPSRSPRRRKKMMITHERKPQVSYPIVPFSSSSSKEPPQLLSLPQTNTFNRTLIFVKLTSEDIHVPLHIESSSVDELIRSLHELYPQSIPPSVSQRFKQNANGILFRLNDDLLEYMNQNEAYEVLIEENEDQETSLTLIEKSI